MKLIVLFWRAQLRRKTAPLLIIAFLSLLTALLVQVPSMTSSYVYSKWRESAQYADVVVGYKGSPLQIVANTMYRLENPTGNLPQESVTYWKKHPMVSESCPVALGDNIDGYPIVGTDTNYFRWMNIALLQGRWPSASTEVVLSAELARRLEISIGDHLHSSHGSDAKGEAHDHHHLEVVGLTRGERTADNEAFFVPVEAYYDMHHGQGDGAVTALMLRLKSKSALVMLPRVFAARANEQGAFPVFIFAGLQKQWAPTLAKLETWGMLLPAAVALLFISFLYFLARGEREARLYLQHLKTSPIERYLALYGLPLISALSGFLLHVLLLWGFGCSIASMGAGVALLPIGSAALLFTRIRS